MFTTPFQHRARAVILAAALLAAQAPLAAQVTAPSPVLTSISPLGGRPGTRISLLVKGAELDDAESLVLTSLRTGALLTVPAVSSPGKKGSLDLSLPAQAPAGLYDLRIRTRFGVSNPRVFQISRTPVVESTGSNTSSATALPVTTDSAIHGTFRSSAPHWFSLTGKKDRRILGAFIGSAWDVRTSLIGTVYDSQGRELARMRDGILDLTPPSDGTFHLKLHDLMFGAGDDYGYRFTLTSGALVWAAGQDSVMGWNLPGGAPTRLLVLRGRPLEHLKAAPDVLAGLLADNPVQPLPLPGGLQPEAPATLTSLSIGQKVAGWFPAHGEARQFDLAFKKDDRFIIEVISQQLGHATDPALLVENVQGDSLTLQAEIADPPPPVPAPGTRLPSLDPCYAYEAKADGLFRLSISDPANAANGRRHPFIIHIRRTSETALEGAVAIPSKLPPAAATGPFEIPACNLWRNGTLALEVFLPGRTPMSEALSFHPGGLPAGVSSLGGFIGKGQSVGYAILRASADAPAGAAALTGLSQTLYVSWPVKDNTRETVLTRLTGVPVIGVVAETAPVLIEPATPATAEVTTGARLDLPLKISRQPGCTEALKLKVLGLTDPAKAPEITLAAKASEGRLTLDVKSLKLAPGEHVCVLQGTAKMPFQKASAELAESTRRTQQAAEARTAAQKALTAAHELLKGLKPDDKAALATQQTKIKELTATLATADKARTEAEKAAKALAAKNTAKDTVFLVHSAPIHFRVLEAVKK